MATRWECGRWHQGEFVVQQTPSPVLRRSGSELHGQRNCAELDDVVKGRKTQSNGLYGGVACMCKSKAGSDRPKVPSELSRSLGAVGRLLNYLDVEGAATAQQHFYAPLLGGQSHQDTTCIHKSR